MIPPELVAIIEIGQAGILVGIFYRLGVMGEKGRGFDARLQRLERAGT